jgi:hypothetical protein
MSQQVKVSKYPFGRRGKTGYQFILPPFSTLSFSKYRPKLLDSATEAWSQRADAKLTKSTTSLYSIE